jgi:hypothetical protein
MRSTLLIPAFSLPIAPALLTVDLLGHRNAPLPIACLIGTQSHGFGAALEPRYIVGAGTLDQ